MKQIVKKLRLTAMTLGILTLGSFGFALYPAATTYAACDNQANIAGIPAWYQGLCEGDNIKSPSELKPKDGSGDTSGIGTFVSIIATNVVKALLVVVGYVSLGFIIYGGFKYIINGDNSSGVSAAKKTILNAVIGLVLSIMSYAIVDFIARTLFP